MKKINIKKLNGKIVIIRYLLLILIILWISFIYGMSAKTGNESAGLSSRITDIVVKIMPFYDNMSANAQVAFYNGLHTFIRKMAHFTEYGILGMLFLSFLGTFKSVGQSFLKSTDNIKYKAQLCAIAFCMVNASLDEYHQSFVDGRGPSIRDVVIDTSGSVFFILFLSFFVKKLFCLKKEKENKFSSYPQNTVDNSKNVDNILKRS